MKIKKFIRKYGKLFEKLETRKKLVKNLELINKSYKYIRKYGNNFPG